MSNDIIPAGTYTITGDLKYAHNSTPEGFKRGDTVILDSDRRPDSDGDVYVQLKGKDEWTYIRASSLTPESLDNRIEALEAELEKLKAERDEQTTVTEKGLYRVRDDRGFIIQVGEKYFYAAPGGHWIGLPASHSFLHEIQERIDLGSL